MTLVYYLAVFGGAALVVIACVIFMMICAGIKELVHTLKLKYIQKHRFDKPPTAKCYCIDCVHHNNESNRCYRFTEYRCTADNWFCWEAEPRKK